VEESVATTHIGSERVLHSHAIAEVNAVFLAGSAAIGVVCAIGHEGGENAVLHVKHRHVMVDRQFDPIRRRLAEEGEDLVGVEIVRKGEPLEAMVFKNRGGDGVRDVQREITEKAKGAFGEMLDATDVPNENAVGLGVSDEFEKALLAGFLDARGCEENGGCGGRRAHCGDSILVATDVFVIDEDFVHPRLESGLELVGCSDEN